MRSQWVVWLALFISLAVAAATAGQEVGPSRIVEIDLPFLTFEDAASVPWIADGVVEVLSECDFCYLSDTQYKVTVPDGAEALVIELVNTSDPLGDIDLIVRHGEPVSEDETSYYYTYRTFEGAGEERLELPEAGMTIVDAGDYYIAVVSFVEDGTTFELRAAAYAGEILPDAVTLEPAKPVDGVLAPGESTAESGWQYAVDVPEHATLLFVHAKSLDGNLDLLVGRRPISIAGGALIAEVQLRGTSSDELLVLGSPTPGAYWVALENRSWDVLDYTLTATPLPAVTAIAASTSVSGTVGWETATDSFLVDRLATDRGILGLEQFRIGLPHGATGVRLRLRGAEVCEIALHLRYGAPVEAIDGVLIADLSMQDGEEKEIVVRDALLPEPLLYAAVEALSVGEKAFALDVEFLFEE